MGSQVTDVNEQTATITESPQKQVGLLETEEELDLFLDKIKFEYKDGWTEENWEEEMEKHPFFMTKQIDENATDLPPAVEALRQLQWDEDETPKECALKYKDEGNMRFKAKNYKSATTSYKSALKLEFDDNDLKSVLYSNLAAAEYHLQNYRTALKTCVDARRFKKDNFKAIVKGAECCFELRLYDDALKWCDNAFLLRKKIDTAKKAHDRDQRKTEAIERKKTEKEKRILHLIKEKKIRCQKGDDTFSMFNKACNPQEAIVDLVDNDTLKWPVTFLYPEYGQTDFIKEFHEYQTFDEYLQMMFEQSPPWDTDHKYNPKSIRIYYEDRVKGHLTPIKKSSTLLEALQQPGYIIQVGTPNFTIMVANSAFEKIYVSKFENL